jgi:septal ring factor EnvC (AmiA/AmiB activator)
VGELNDTKLKKGETLEVQNKELDVLAVQQEEKNKAIAKLKAQSKELNAHIAASKKQMAKVSSAIAAAIKRARDEAIAKAKAEAAEKLRREKAELAANKAANASSTVKTTSAPTKTKAAPVKQESVLLATAADVKLNASFKSNKGSLPWPVDKGYVMVRFGSQTVEGTHVVVNNPGITIGTDIGIAVKAIFDGEVSAVSTIDNMQVVIIKHGSYFSTYSNLTGVNLSRGQAVRTGQVLGRAAANDEGVGSIDLITSDERNNFNPESWLKAR